MGGEGQGDVCLVFLKHVVNFSANVATARSLQIPLGSFPENRTCTRSVAVHVWFILLAAAAFLAGQFKG